MCFFSSKKHEPLMSDKEFEDYIDTITKETPIRAVKTTGGIGAYFGKHRIYLSSDNDYAVIGFYSSADFSSTQRQYLHKKIKELIKYMPVEYI